jgi:membrane glycosyltransferase
MGTLSLQPGRLSLIGRRLCFGLLVIVTVAAIGWRALLMLQINGWDPLKGMSFFLFLTLLVPIALSFWTALIGFAVRCRGGDSLDLTRVLEPKASPAMRLPRTAVVMPVYNEEPVRVFAGLKATYQSLRETGCLPSFDFFVLSDTTDPDIWVREEMAFVGLQKEVGEPGRLIYRNRRENFERKSGNIADFCATWGDRYTYMIVLDADSIMTGTSLVNLVRLMETNPGVGIVQAPPLPVNRRTLFGRLQQFAMHAYSAVFITGLNFWQGGAANYWGHNAILRIRPFVEHCRLPKLPGKEPLGGSILSHDFVEAAFMRRAGWKVYLASELRGSYEEVPASLIGYTARDRRWCQGNLQHARLLCMPRFHFVNRVHLGMGVMAYLASPLWLLLLALTTFEGIRENLDRHPYFPPSPALFPTWRISVEHQAILLFGLMLALLLLPKVLSLMLSLAAPRNRAAFGGGLRLAASVLCEMLVSTLLAPILALLQARFVAGILMGRKVQWNAGDRGEAETSLREALRRHWPATLLGAGWALLLWLTAPKLLWWFSPVIAGFLLAVPLSAWSSRIGLGEWARRHGLFLIPEEVAPPRLLQHFQHELAQAAGRPWAVAGDGLARVLEEPEVCAIHLSFRPSPPETKDELQQHYCQGLELKVRHRGVPALTAREKRELLLNANSIQALQADRLARMARGPEAKQEPKARVVA